MNLKRSRKQMGMHASLVTLFRPRSGACGSNAHNMARNAGVSTVAYTRRKACSHESSWSRRGALVGRRGTVVGNITSPTMLRRHVHDTSTMGSCWYRGVCAHCLPCSIGGSHNGSYRGSIVEASWTTTILYKMCFNRSSMLYCCGMDGHHYLQ